MTDSPKLAGVLPVFQMPYNDDESIDLATLEREIDFLYEHGADGVVFAMVSEILRLSSDERLAVAEQVCKFDGGRGVVVISVGAESAFLATRHAHHAQDCGADAV